MQIEIDGTAIAAFLVFAMLLILAWQTDKNRQRIEKLERRPTMLAPDGCAECGQPYPNHSHACSQAGTI